MDRKSDITTFTKQKIDDTYFNNNMDVTIKVENIELKEKSNYYEKINNDEENLYDNHIIKEELVIGPEVVQYPYDNTTAYETTRLSVFSENGLKIEQISLKKIKTEIDKEILYENHIIKEELVIGEEVIQKPDAIITYESFTEQDYNEHESKKPKKIDSEISKKIIKNKSVKETTIKSPNTNTTKENASKNKHKPKEKQSNLMLNTNKCHICDKTFTLAANLSRHKRLIHVGIKPYTCIACGDSFKYIEPYKNHVSKHGIHIKKKLDRKSVCRFCNIKLADRRTCDRHEQFYCSKNENRRVRPTKLLQFVCDVCLKSYKRKNSLEVHMGLHFGSRSLKFQCDHCSKKYSRKLNLKFHVQAKHLEQREFSSLKCGKSFARQWSLKVHKCMLCFE